MDPFSALAIAAAVVQFAEFGGKILKRTWDKYLIVYKGSDSAYHVAQESSDLTALTIEISELAKAVQIYSDGVVAGGSLAESQLLKLCTECESIETEFKPVLNRIDNRKRRTIDKDDKRARNKIPRLALAGLWDRHKIDQMDNLDKDQSFADLRRADSKKTAKWELHFTETLDTILGILARVEKSTSEQAESTRDMKGSKRSDPLTLELDDICQTLTSEDANSRLLASGVDGKLREVISSLIKARESISLQRVGQEITAALTSSDSADAKNVRAELVRLLWNKRWTLDSSMAMFATDQVHGKPELTDVGRDISHGLYFDSMYDREDAVANNFEATYEWIFQHEPKKSDGKVLWYSFPEWLAEESNTPYWITGKPGSGKSTIMKLIARPDRLRTFLQPWAKSLPIVITNYYAWNSGLNLQKAWEGLKKTVLHQVLNQYPSAAPRIAPRRWALFQALRGMVDFPDWEEWEIDESFQALMNECGVSMAMALFVDGLDEFEIPPATVVSNIRSMANDAAQGIKVCVASRPWTEFEDAFNDGPMLQMHLLTEDDMMTFVTNSFQQNRGYIELKNVYPRQIAKLTDDVVQKADGVFLWVSFVVMELIDLFTAGDSMAQLQETLEKLPTNLSSLFDAIWARVPHRHLPDACAMIRLARSAYGPLPWLLMWLADESRSIEVDPSAMSPEVKYHAKRGLKRRLATRTRGILELSGAAQEVVNFAHRTTRDWVKQAHIWEELCASCESNFEPHLVLLQAETLLMFDSETTSDYPPSHFWLAIMRALWYASQFSARSSQDKLGALIQTLDTLDRAASEAFWRAQGAWPTVYQLQGPDIHWSSVQDVFDHRRGLPNTFLGLAAQFSILPYLESRLHTRRSFLQQWNSKDGIGLLENAVFGYKYYMAENFDPPNGLPTINRNQRLAAVQFLLDRGLRQAKGHSRHHQVSIRDELRCLAGEEGQDSTYYSEVIRCLDSASLLQSTFRRFKSVLHK
ncbi:uncharacterized protein FMAN_09446 [Fusarium mangiferae]|uniref:Nephrocystin 3-like N-terminal domain-containing protein n=1 Tax=Fusarium mangiferae TaxID=192010 RepID=A0A1L7T598_FUSMA|nr:uncharacterized protein FMAN_09446 [Fusarium mangiferae]CVK91303.1 uncharacterized protein FMAN_09446 [Fusarium mangiferae]